MTPCSLGPGCRRRARCSTSAAAPFPAWPPRTHARAPGVALLGIDVSEQNIAAAQVLLDGLGAEATLVVVDLDGPIPLDDATVDTVICHNVLECLADPVHLLDDAQRVLRAGGTAVWSHPRRRTASTTSAAA